MDLKKAKNDKILKKIFNKDKKEIDNIIKLKQKKVTTNNNEVKIYFNIF